MKTIKINDLAGYEPGEHELSCGERVMVRNGAHLLVPERGRCDLIRELIEGRLGDQAVYFHAWCKWALYSLLFDEPGGYKPGHLMVLAGPIWSGKSCLQREIITPLLGDRMADPSKCLLGEGKFNAEMLGAEHLMIEELPTQSGTMKARVRLAEALKSLVVGGSKRLRMMRTDPLTVEPFWRVSLSINDDRENLRSFPMLTDDFADKVIMLRVVRRPMPLPMGKVTERRVFHDQIRAELPAYAYWLLNGFVLPASMMWECGDVSPRFGFASWQHPLLAAELLHAAAGVES